MRPWANLDGAIAALSVGGIAAHLALRAAGAAGYARVPLLVVLALGGTPLVGRLLANAARGTFGADFLAAVSIVAASFLGEFLAGAIIVLMLSGGEALERYAVAQAGAVLRALVPCPLLIAIPVAIIGAISTAARRGIIIRDPAALEQLTLAAR